MHLDHPNVVATYETEDGGKRLLNVITNVEIEPDRPGFDAQARAALWANLRERFLRIGGGFDTITLTTHRNVPRVEARPDAA